MDANAPDDWTDKKSLAADEMMLLAAGSHGTKPKQQSYMVVGKLGGTANELQMAALPVHGGYYSYLPNFIESMLVDVLDADAAFSINSMFRPGNRDPHCEALKGCVGPDGNPIMEGFRKREGISRLNACFVDLDCYKIGITRGQAIGALYDASQAGTIPTPSYLKDSGQGIWAFWLLGREERHFPNHVDLWDAIQLKLSSMFQSQGADAGAKDAARLTRLLGSRNTKVNRRVNMVVFGRDTSGQPIRYTLAEMAAHLKIELPKKRQKRIEGIDRPKNPKNQHKGVVGQASRWKKDEERFWLLAETIRKSIPVGTRHAHNLVIGAILRYRFRDDRKSLDSAIADAAIRLWKLHPKTDKEFNRDTIEAEIRKAAEGLKATGKVSFRMTHQTIANSLKVTTGEAEKIRTLTMSQRGGTWPPADGQDQLPKTTASRAEVRAAVKSILRSRNNFPGQSDQTVADFINELGIDVSRETVRKLRHELRPPKTIDTMTLPNILD